jgi:hypothetical protein
MGGTIIGRLRLTRLIIQIVKRELEIDLAVFDQGVSGAYRRL